MPTRSIITCFRFHSRRIDGVKFGLFLNHAPLGDTTLRVGRVSVQCTAESLVQGNCKCNCLCNVIVLCGMMMREGETRCRPIACSSRKAPRGLPRLTFPSDGRIAINSTICLLNIHTVEGSGILIQDCDVQTSDQKVYISTPPNPEVENFQMKSYYPAGDRTPDMLIQRQTCQHLSQRGKLIILI